MRSHAAAALVLAAVAGPALLANPSAAQSPYPSVIAPPGQSTETHLVDPDGTILQTWTGEPRVTAAAYDLGDGSILRPCDDPDSPFPAGGAGRAGGRIQRIDGTNQVVWDYYFSTEQYRQHHDIEPMPNGNVLVIAWERVSNADGLAAGRVGLTGEIWPTLIAEIEPVGATGGNIVWEWRVWDHLVQDVDPAKPNYGVIADHPERFDVNVANVNNGDWIHANCLSYDAVRDLIVFSSRSWDEFFVIDHGTTTEEAAGSTGGARGRGGDILYRWGNPQNYGRGTEDDRYFVVIHGANFIDEGAPGTGNILAFNNGNRPGTANDYSTVAEIDPPWNGSGFDILPGQPFGPAAPAWEYGDPGVFYGGPTQCGAYRVPNGNTRITSRAEDRVFEVTPAGGIVWNYVHPGGVTRATLGVHPAVAVPGVEVARGPRLRAAPNPFSERTRIRLVGGVAGASGPVEIVSPSGRRVVTLPSVAGSVVSWDGRDASGRRVAAGVYFARVAEEAGLGSVRLTILR